MLDYPIILSERTTSKHEALVTRSKLKGAQLLLYLQYRVGTRRLPCPTDREVRKETSPPTPCDRLPRCSSGGWLPFEPYKEGNFAANGPSRPVFC